MRSTPTLVSSVVLVCVAVACYKSDNKAADTQTAMATPAAPAAPAPIKLSDVAGNWTVNAKNETGDSVLVTYQMTATADTNGWSLKFSNRPTPEHVRVASVGGDSVVLISGPYESVLRKGVKVTTTSTIRLQDGKLVGTGVARYTVKTADSVRQIRFEGTRAP